MEPRESCLFCHRALVPQKENAYQVLFFRHRIDQSKSLLLGKIVTQTMKPNRTQFRRSCVADNITCKSAKPTIPMVCALPSDLTSLGPAQLRKSYDACIQRTPRKSTKPRSMLCSISAKTTTPIVAKFRRRYALLIPCSHINSHNQVRGHRTGSSHSGAGEYPRKKTQANLYACEAHPQAPPMQ